MTPQAEKIKKSKIFTVFDVILIAIVLILCLLPLFFSWIGGPRVKGKFVRITHNGEFKIYSLSQNSALTIDGAVIKIENGAVFFESNNCPTKQCVNTGKISNSGDSAICIPKKIYVEIIGDGFDGSSK